MGYKYNQKLKGQRVLILGGTSGIGFSVAEASLEQGATVIISGSNQAKLDKKLSELKQSYPEEAKGEEGGRILGKTCDLSNLESQESNIVALLDFATDNKTKPLDHLINTAGDGLYNPAFADLTVEIIQKSQTVRVMGPLMLAKHAQTYMNKSPTSSFTLTSGAGTYKPLPGWTLMPIIGGMFDGLVTSLAVNLAPIRVNGIAPGAVLTELWGGGEKLPEEKARQLEESQKGGTLTGRVARPEDVAEAYLWVMKDRSVTGRMTLSEGGMMLK